MSEIYHDRNEQIKHEVSADVSKEFKRIDKVGYRDDQEIMNAGWNIVDKYVKEIKNDKTKIWGSWALAPLTDLRNSLVKEYNACKGAKLITHNADKINSIANRIDNAENETLKRLQLNKTNKNSKDMIYKSAEIHGGKKLFEMEKVDGKETRKIIFTKESNPVKIHDALKGLFTNPNQTYKIDYSKCTNEKIKNKMTSLIGNNTCYLYYDSEQKTYTIRNNDGSLKERALIWEGVRLIPAGVSKFEAEQKEQTANSSLGKIETADSKIKDLLIAMPSAKKLTSDQQKKLILASENRLQVLIKKAKQLGYELASEPITKKWTGAGLMEMEVISGNSERSWTIRGKDYKGGTGNETVNLGKDLYKFLDGEEGEYKTYLTNVIKRKWTEMDKLTKVQKVDLKGTAPKTEEEAQKNAEMKIQALHGIDLLEQMVNNYRDTEGDSRLDNDDKKLVKIKNLIRSAKKSIEDVDSINKQSLISEIINPIYGEWSSFKNIQKYIDNGNGVKTINPEYTKHYNYMTDVFFGSNEKQITAIRMLGSKNRIFDKTETSFLQQEIEGNETLEVKFTDVQKNINNIDAILSLSDDDVKYNEESGEIIPNEKTKLIDELYAEALNGNDNLITRLETNKILPDGWNSKKKTEKLVRESVDQLRNKLKERNSLANNFPVTLESIAQGQYEEKLKLEQKENKSEADLQKLQALEYLESNPNQRYIINQYTLNTMKSDAKYGDMQQLVKGTLYSMFVELGGGAIGENGAIYNDIVGYGFWNASDSNAKIIGEIAKVIAITVAVSVCTMGMGGVVVAGALRVAGGLAKAAKRSNMASKIAKLSKLAKVGMRGFKAASKAGKFARIGMQSTKLLLEGTIFNAASNVIHSATNGTSLDNINLNPVAKENIQTAAFLGALSIGNQIAGVLMQVGGKTKLCVNLMKGLEKAHLKNPAVFTTQVTAELTTMLAAEQAINFVYGHDVINPDTGEIDHVRTLTPPTKEELIQTVGMILAFKMVKPGIWQNVEKKLNDGTLEICRSTKKGEILLKDSKTGEIKPLQEMIDGQYNNFKPTPEQQRLSNQNRRLENQSKAFETAGKELNIENMGLDWIQTQLKNIPEGSRSDTVKKILEYKDIMDVSSNDIKRLQRELGFVGKEVDGIFGKNSAKKLLDKTKITTKEGKITEQSGKENNQNGFRDFSELSEQEQKLREKFDEQIMSKDGVTIDGITYKLEWQPNMTQNQGRKGRIIYTETGPDGKVRKTEVASDTFVLPDNSGGNGIRNRFNAAREKYLKLNTETETKNTETETKNTEKTLDDINKEIIRQQEIRKQAETKRKAEESKKQQEATKRKAEETKKKQEKVEHKVEEEIIIEVELDPVQKLNQKEINDIGRNITTETSEYFNNSELKPEFSIDLGNGEKMFVTKRLISGGREYICGYTKNPQGKMEVRLFYKSNSEGYWRSCPGLRHKWMGGGYSKGEGLKNASYETSTKVSVEINKHFESLDPKSGFDLIKYSETSGRNFLESGMKKETNINKLFYNYKYSNTVDYMKEHSSSDVIEMYKKLGSNFPIETMKIEGNKSYSYSHKYLGEIKVDVCSINFNGKLIDFHFGHAPDAPNKIWIENVTYSDAKVNSFGIYDKQINASPLTGKPIDYAEQVPHDMYCDKPRIEDSNYIDIRDLYQENSIIKKYKELSGVSQNAPVKVESPINKPNSAQEVEVTIRSRENGQTERLTKKDSVKKIIKKLEDIKFDDIDVEEIAGIANDTVETIEDFKKFKNGEMSESEFYTNLANRGAERVLEDVTKIKDNRLDDILNFNDTSNHGQLDDVLNSINSSTGDYDFENIDYHQSENDGYDPLNGFDGYDGNDPLNGGHGYGWSSEIDYNGEIDLGDAA